MRTQIQNSQGASSIAFAMFFTLVLGYFSVLSMQGVSSLMQTHSLADLQTERVKLKSELTLLLWTLNSKCTDVFEFAANSSDTTMSAPIKSLKFLKDPSKEDPVAGTHDTYVTFLTAQAGQNNYGNFVINSIELVQRKALPNDDKTTYTDNSYLSDVVVKFTHPSSPREQTVAVPVFFVVKPVDPVTLLAGPLTTRIDRCYSTQMTLACDAAGSCQTWHEQFCTQTDDTYTYYPDKTKSAGCGPKI